MTIFTFVLMQISRYEFVKAIVRVFWREIAPDEYSYYGSCSIKGELMYPEAVTVEGIYFRQAVKEAIILRIKSWERAAYVYLVYALCLNIPYIYFLYVLSRDLTFTQGGWP